MIKELFTLQARIIHIMHRPLIKRAHMITLPRKNMTMLPQNFINLDSEDQTRHRPKKFTTLMSGQGSTTQKLFKNPNSERIDMILRRIVMPSMQSRRKV